MAIDIETRPALVYTWRLFETTVGVDQIVEPGGVICFAAKWIGERKTEFWSDFHDGHDVMVDRLRELLDEADVLLHYNGRSFDVPHIQREFVEAGIMPPAPFKQIDLYSTVKKNFRFLSKKLAHVAPQIGLEGKVGHEGFMLWRKCIDGDAAAWKRMRRYNVRDVTLLEEAYEILRPWIPSHPSHAAYSDQDVCPKCGGEHLQWRGFITTALCRYRRFQCQSCGAWGRSTHRESHVGVTQAA